MKFDSSDSLKQVFKLIARLRGPDGCPWDQRQKFENILSDIVEEAYELEWAASHHGNAEVLDEMGDLVFLICFAISIRREEDPDFNLDAIARHAWEKIYNRHPHVFGTESADTPEESIVHWERIKAEERERKNDGGSALDGVPGNLPPIRHAEKIQGRAASVGFDWDDAVPIIAKVREELAELEEAIEAGNRDEVQHEIGDLLFSVINVSRFLNHDPEGALNRTTSKFIKRFTAMETLIEGDNKRLKDMTLAEMDEYWERIKRES